MRRTRPRARRSCATGCLPGADALDDGLVMFKLTLPEQANFYADLCAHAKVLRVVALSGGYSREVANDRLAANNGMIASFSRALTEGLRVDLDATPRSAACSTSP